MKEYRKEVEPPTGEHWIVELGPVPNMPKWYQEMYAYSSYAFPTEHYANLFAANHGRLYPGREISVRKA